MVGMFELKDMRQRREINIHEFIKLSGMIDVTPVISINPGTEVGAR